MAKVLFAWLLLALPLWSSAQQAAGQVTVTGSVKDSSGAMLPGVTVLVAGVTGKGTTTNTDGRFVLDVRPNATLQFTLMGFETISVPLAGRTTVDVVLREKVSQLTDVVITAYGKSSSGKPSWERLRPSIPKT